MCFFWQQQLEEFGTGSGKGSGKNPNNPNSFLRIGGPLIFYECGTHWSKWDFLSLWRKVIEAMRESAGFDLNTVELFHEQWYCGKFKCFTRTFPPHHCRRLVRAFFYENYWYEGFWHIFQYIENTNLSKSSWPIKVDNFLGVFLSAKMSLHLQMNWGQL